ncbi:hypothetical protein GLAREA_02388 [Glarea lozoyensis ATCC 20868]|uniref:Uncharacterized protein n=1 Tax=Glarea lozoyensis (strain ATCC 20868 / MF5171) TaxID=1116229 RepID=S3CL34_GLAL2|nr:uncharacterized protein GLAREA_02388 [Glarea lozoyensis ATCC 20868]EPE26475.1 hypothetical protein GLAREA_02388 [Glarea lozoyensis ATCC 20868]
MITRKTFPSHICLRCQSRLARLSKSYNSQFAIRSASTDADSSPTPKPLPAKRLPPRSDIRQHRLFLVPHGRLGQPTHRHYKFIRKDDADFYGHTGQKLLGEREKLQIKTLGKPTDVIILRGSKISHYSPRQRYIPDNGQQNIDIIARLDRERGLVDQTEVEKNIDEFRPKENEEPKTRKEFNAFVDKLQNAFNSPQLEEYIGSFEGKLTLQTPPEFSPRSSLLDPIDPSCYADDALVLVETPWLPETSAPNGYLEEKLSLRGYALASHTKKQRLVVKLLRECWKLELPDVVSWVGHIDLLLRPGDVEHLAQSPLLEAMLEKILPKDDEGVELYHETNIVRVTGTYRHCGKAVKLIKDTLKMITRKTISLSKLFSASQGGISGVWQHTPDDIATWADRHFDEATLEELGKLTNCYISISKGKSMSGKKSRKSIQTQTKDVDILLSCIYRESWRSSRNDMAQRLLLSSDPFTSFPSRTHHVLGCRQVPNWNAGIFAASTAQDLPWKQKLREWTRWIAPVRSTTAQSGDEKEKRATKDVAKSQAHGPYPSGDEIESSAELQEKTSTIPMEDENWETESHVNSSAVFGRILHSHSKTSTSNQPTSPWGTIHTLRAFSTELPNVNDVLRRASLHPKGNRETLTLRFIPNPCAINPTTKEPIGLHVLSQYPPINMHFDIHEDQPLHLRSVEAITQEVKSDLMLPDQAVDVRFLRHSFRQLKPQKFNMPAITDFMKGSYMTRKARRLDIPPTINLPTLALTPTEEQSGTSNGVEYVFAEREVRSTLFLTYNDWALECTHIVGGKSSGTRSELSMKHINDSSESTQVELYDAALSLAESFGSSTGTHSRQSALEDGAPLISCINAKRQVVTPLIRTLSSRKFAEHLARPQRDRVLRVGWEPQKTKKAKGSKNRKKKTHLKQEKEA